MKITQRKILVVDDDPQILDLIIKILQEEGFSHIYGAQSQRRALEIWEEEAIDLALLDILLPDGSGFDIIKMIRKESRIPVLFLSALSDIEKQYSGFILGGDDYMVKPFQAKELILRLRALLNRSYPESQVIVLRGCKIDLDKGLVLKEGEEIPLTAKEFHILQVLYENKNRIVTIDGILAAVWGQDYYGYENTLMAHIRKIRVKIEEDPSQPENLLTFKGLGYKLQVEP